MNIWLLTNEYPPFYGGGIGTYAQTMANVFAKGGHKITVFTLGEKASEEINGNLRVVWFERFGDKQAMDMENIYGQLDWLSTLPYQFADVILKELDKGSPPDIIEVQDCLAIGYFLLQKKELGEPLLKNIPIVVNLHMPLSVVKQENLASKYHFYIHYIERLEKSCLRLADAVICPSQFLKDKIQDWCPGKEITVMPLPVPEIRTRTAKVKQSTKKIDVLYIGRLEYRKGSLQLLDSVEKLWQRGLEFTLTLIGGDEWYQAENCLMSELFQRKYAKYIESGFLKIIKNSPQAQVYELLKKAKFFVMPSLFENFPYVCLEAMCFGKPMLASVSGGQAEMIGQDSSCGLLFDWNVQGDFEIQLTRLLALKPWELWAMGQKARRRILKLCNHKDNLNNKIKIFQKVIINSKKRIEIATNKAEGLLSVVIPFQDQAFLIAKTLQSVLESDYQNKEIIIVNAGSIKQDSLDVLREIENAGFPNLRIIQSNSDSLATATNLGANAAKGKYLAFIDPGSLVLKTFYTKMIATLEKKNKAGIVYSWVELAKLQGGQKKVWMTEEMSLPAILLVNPVPSTIVVMKDIFLKYGLYDDGLVDDLVRHDSCIRLCQAGFEGISIPEIMVQLQQREIPVLHNKLLAKHKDIAQEHLWDILLFLNENKQR